MRGTNVARVKSICGYTDQEEVCECPLCQGEP